MKKNLFFAFAVLLSLLCFVSCQGDLVSPSCQVSVTDTAVFVLKQPTPVFGSCIPGLRATVTALNDSRCPKNAVCVTAGTLVVTLEMGNELSMRLVQHEQVDTA